MHLLATLLNTIESLQNIDYGYVQSGTDQEREDELEYLEATLDQLQAFGISSPEGDLAVRFFLTDPERSRSYLYGPTDLRDGKGLIDKLKELAALVEQKERSSRGY
jgi:hypothetical protein